MLTLYEVAISPYVQKVKIALREKSIPFALESAELGVADSPLASVNPRCEVPTLVDGDVRVFDSTIILEYIEDRWPEPPLLPKDPGQRARVRAIEEVCDTEFDAINHGLTEVVLFGRAGDELAESMRGRAKADTSSMLAFLGRELGDREFFDGDRFGRADIAVLPHLNNAVVLGNGPLAGSPLDGWRKRVNGRASVVQTLAEAKAALALLKAAVSAIAEGRAARLYRDHRLEWLMRAGGLPIVMDGLARKTIRFSPGIH